jgi:hypothetical protein
VVARVFGWTVLSVGLVVALAVALAAHALFPAGFAGLLIGGPIAVLSLVLGVFLLRGSARLDRNGASAERSAHTQAVYALASHKGGTLTALDVATALDMRPPAAEALLQSLAKEQYEHVGVDVDPAGTLVYRFNVPTGPAAARVRVDPEIARSPNRGEWERLERLEAEEATRAAAGEGSPPSRASRVQR